MQRHKPGLRTLKVSILIAMAWGAIPASADVSITPRLAYFFDNITQRQSSTDFNTPSAQAQLNQIAALVASVGGTTTAQPVDNARNSAQAAYPLYGGTVTFGWRDNDATQVALTALYGTTNKSDTTIVQEYFDYTLAGFKVQDSMSVTTKRKGEFKRLDIEATLQHRLNETFSVIGGIRAERVDSDFARTSTSSLTTNFFNLFAAVNGLAPFVFPPSVPDTANESISTWTYSARIGAAAYAPVGDKHLFYVNGLVQYSSSQGSPYRTVFANGNVSEQELPGETTLGPDISVGYMYRMSDRFGIDVRYRATVYFTINGPSSFDDARVNHGLSLGFTTWLGSR